MIRRFLTAVILMACSTSVLARERVEMFIGKGGATVSVAGFTSSTKVQSSLLGCRVYVYEAGTTNTVTIYSSVDGTTTSNPGTASTTDGSFGFWVDDNLIDITIASPCSTGVVTTGLPFTFDSVKIGEQKYGQINVKDFGAKGDRKQSATGGVSAASTTLTCTGCGFTAADAGKFIRVYGAGASAAALTTTIATYTSANVVELTASASTTVTNALVVFGTDDYTAINRAFTYARNAGVSLSSTATSAGNPGINNTGSIATVYFPAGGYLVSDEFDLSQNSHLNIVAPGKAVIEQTTSTKKILKLTSGYMISIRGMTFLNGTTQILYQNANVDTSMFLCKECEFQNSSSYAFMAFANTSASGSGYPYSTGTIAVTNASTAVTGTTTVWTSAHAGKDIKITVAGVDSYYRIAEVTSNTAIILNRPWAGSNASGLSYEIGDYHLSANVTFDKTKFIRPVQAIFTAADMTVVRDSWLFPDGVGLEGNFCPDTAFVRNFAGTLVFDGMFGVPTMGDQTNGTISSCLAVGHADRVAKKRIVAARWVDLDNGRFRATNHTRFGGEDGGMAIVYNWAPYWTDVSPFTAGSSIIIENSEVYAGQTAESIRGVLVFRDIGTTGDLRENIPQQFVFKHNNGHAGTPVINNVDSLNVSTFLAGQTGGGLGPEYKFRYDIGGSLTGGDTTITNGANALLQFQPVYPVAATLNFPVVTANTCSTAITIAVEGAELNQTVQLGVPNGSMDTNVLFFAWVSAADVVSVKACNVNTVNSADLASGTFRVVVERPQWYRDN